LDGVLDLGLVVGAGDVTVEVDVQLLQFNNILQLFYFLLL